MDHPWLSDDAERPSSPIKLDDMALVPRKPDKEPCSGWTTCWACSRRIAVCLRSAFATYQDVPGVSRALRRGAVLCRSQLPRERQIVAEDRAHGVFGADIHDDLELAVDAGQSALARELVATVKGWVGGLKEAVKDVQQGNAAQMRHLHQAIS